ncbi:MAG TPA: hypothetical protein VGR05_01100, partial [Sphingomicrobium sp.]|nr:hypothetical protein [Sphingomicrobium sp.]
MVLQIDTTEGDSTRTIIQRDFDYGDRIQPLILDSTTMADIWRPGDGKINFSPLAQTRANFVVRGRPTATGLHIEIFDVKGRLRQEGVFRLPRLPPNRLPAIRDSLSGRLAERMRATYAALAADSAVRDSLAREATRPTPLKHPGQRVAARLSAAARDSITRELDRRDVILHATAVQDTLHLDSVFARIASRDSIVRDSAVRERRFAIHG